MSQVSVIICSHRAPRSLRGCLASLCSQTVQTGFEVVLVNNGFPTSAEQSLCKLVAASPARFRFSIYHEPVPGLGHARVRGFEEANGKWLVLLDDDNTLEADFMENLFRILEEYPSIGGIVPRVSPVWEKRPPTWLEGWGSLCLSYNVPDPHRVDPLLEELSSVSDFQNISRPPGGGMIVHGKVADAYLAAPNKLARVALARTGNSLVGCEDADLWNQIQPLGMDILKSNRLRVNHHIPASRLALPYLLRLNFQMQFSYQVLARLTRHSEEPDKSSILKCLLLTSRLLKIGALNPLEHPFAKQLLLAACEWGRLAGNLARLEDHGS